MPEQSDVLVSGGGIAGLTAAAVFGAMGYDVICVDPAPPVTSRDALGSDLRTTAILQPAKALLEKFGLWQRLAPHAMPLRVMRIVDAGGEASESRVVREFRADEISNQPFGWNLPNWLLRREFLSQLTDLPSVSFRPGVSTSSLFSRTGEARVGLSDGSKVSTRLVIAADGRNSFIREAAGIGVTKKHYGQKALAFAVNHTLPHESVSTEIHRSGGPFTLVPLPDYKGKPSSAVVWMETGPKAQELYELSDDACELAVNERACGLLGELHMATGRALWPITSQHAETMQAERVALMAEAAHVVPPIGAQGLNMSLADLRCLTELAAKYPDDLGCADMLAAYDKARMGDIRLRVQGIDLLNRASMADVQALRDVRAAGLSAIYALPQIRHMLMRMGLGVA